MSYYSGAMIAERAEPSARVTFIRKTYIHLAMAILAFIGLEAFLLQPTIAEPILKTFLSGKYSWLIVLGAFMLISNIASKWASSQQTMGMQYLGLSLYVVAEAVIFVPLLYIAQSYMPEVIAQAGVVTLSLFLGLTGIVFITRKDFSFMGSILTVCGFVALGVIVCSIIFGFNLGVLFSGLMILFAAGAILYDTSNILHKYNTDQHVAASLSLFASVALLFWYVLRILMAFTSRD